MDIGEVARRSRLTVSTLRFYEAKELIRSVGRRGLRRQFRPDVLERLALVALGRSASFSLDEIARMLPEFQPQWDVRKGVEQLFAAYVRNQLAEKDLTSSRFLRMKKIKELQGADRLDDTLRWRPEAAEFATEETKTIPAVAVK